MTDVIIKRRNLDTETGMHRKDDVKAKGVCHVKMEDWSDAHRSQRMLTTAGKPTEARKRQGRMPLQVSEEEGPADTSVAEL